MQHQFSATPLDMHIPALIYLYADALAAMLKSLPRDDTRLTSANWFMLLDCHHCNIDFILLITSLTNGLV